MRARYIGHYDIPSRSLILEVVARGERLGLVTGRDLQELKPAGEHEFRSQNGQIVFEMEKGRARALTLIRPDGRSVRAVRTK